MGGDADNGRAKNAGKEVAEEKPDETPSTPPSTSPLDNGYKSFSRGSLTAVDTDISPLLTRPDRQRSRKLLETCLREINYLMTPQQLPTSDHQQQGDWAPRNTTTATSPQHARLPPPQQPQSLHPQWQSKLPASFPQPESSREVNYVAVESDAFRPQEDEELPRKLPKKVLLPTPPPDPWTEADPKISTILERPQTGPRHSARRAFEKRDDGPRTFQHIHTLRSHLAPVRAVIPVNSGHPDETCFVTAGDDSVIKFWRVGRAGVGGKKRGSFDVLPQITYRGHAGMVTCLAESVGILWSGGSDGGIRGWKVPSPTRDSYGSSGTKSPAQPLITLCSVGNWKSMRTQ